VQQRCFYELIVSVKLSLAYLLKAKHGDYTYITLQTLK